MAQLFNATRKLQKEWCTTRPPRFQRVKAPDKSELEELVQLISRRIGRCLERQGLLEQDAESAWLDLDPAEHTGAMPQILGSSISYRIAVGPQHGKGTNASANSAHSMAIARFNACNASEYWKTIATHSPLICLYFEVTTTSVMSEPFRPCGPARPTISRIEL